MSSFEYETFEEPKTKFEVLLQVAYWANQLEKAKAASEEVMKSIVDESEEPPKPKKRALKRAREVTVDEEQDSDEPPKKKKSPGANKKHVLYLSYLNTFPEFEGKMNEKMRKQALLDDRYIGKIIDKRLVQCAGCKQNRKLDGDYAWNNWKHHRQNCKTLFESWLEEIRLD